MLAGCHFHACMFMWCQWVWESVIFHRQVPLACIWHACLHTRGHGIFTSRIGQDRGEQKDLCCSYTEWKQTENSYIRTSKTNKMVMILLYIFIIYSFPKITVVMIEPLSPEVNDRSCTCCQMVHQTAEVIWWLWIHSGQPLLRRRRCTCSLM